MGALFAGVFCGVLVFIVLVCAGAGLNTITVSRIGRKKIGTAVCRDW